jgi:ribosome-associated protein
MKKNLAMVGTSKHESLSVAKRIVEACEDVKGGEVIVLDVASISDFADYFIVASGRSDRQVQGITNRVIEELSRHGVRPLSVEGYEDGQWVLIDCGDVVAHIFYEPVRSEYDLEGLWMRARKLDIVRAA